MEPSQNLKFVGLDPDFKGHTPRLSPYHFACREVVAHAIKRWVFEPDDQWDILHGYKRSIPDAHAAHQFFLKYDVEHHDIIKDNIYEESLSEITEMFRPEVKLRPVHFTDLRWYPWNLSTNAERPFSGSRILREALREARNQGLIDNEKVSFHNLFNHVFVRTRDDIHKIKDGLCFTGKPKADRLYRINVHQKPAMTRFDEPDKVRSVFGVPKVHIMAEAMFMWPLFNQYHKHGKSPMLWGYETLNGGWYKLNAEYYQRFNGKRPIFSLDWSEFDMRAYFTVLDDIRSNWKTYFDFESGYIPTRTYPDSKADPVRLNNLWDWTTYALKEMESVSPIGRVYKRLYAGIPSGAFTTQFMDSFYNGLMILSCLKALKLPTSKDMFLKLMGDDSLFAPDCWISDYSKELALDAMTIEAKRRFNSKLSSKKSTVTDSINGASVLSYENRNGLPWRNQNQLLAQLYLAKSYNDDYSKLKARAVGICFADAGNHATVRDVCSDVFNFLDVQGIKANRAGLKQLWDPHTMDVESIEIDRFPSITEVTARLTRPSFRSSLVQHQYWNDDHFLTEY
nr:MAG: putative RNA-dependent RNA polymerase [Partitiviridae sp.]